MADDDDDTFESMKSIKDEEDHFFTLPTSAVARKKQATPPTASAVPKSVTKLRSLSANDSTVKAPGKLNVSNSLPGREKCPRPRRPNYENVARGFKQDQFLHPPPVSLHCSKCQHVLRDPHLLSCCGTHLCQDCIKLLREECKACPNCGSTEYDNMLNKHQMAKVEQLRVACPLQNKGCNWTGYLKEQDHHVQEECLYFLVACPRACGSAVSRGSLGDHQCRPKRSIDSPSKSIDSEFQNSLSLLEVKLLEQSREIEATKQEMKQQLQKENNEQYTRYNAMMMEQNKEIEILKKESAKSQQREAALLKKIHEQDKRIEMLEKAVEGIRAELSKTTVMAGSSVTASVHIKLPPCDFIVDQFTQRQRFPGNEWYSDPFYTGPQGYKLCLQVVAYGLGESAGKNVSVCIKLMRGEYDNYLSFPFYADITVQILNSLGDYKHATRVISFRENAMKYGACHRVFQSEKADLGWGITAFIPHSYLPYRRQQETQFVKNDSMSIRIANISVVKT